MKEDDKPARHITMKVGTGHFKIEGQSVGLIHAGQDFVNVEDHKGSSKSRISEDGNIQADISGTPHLGRNNEPNVIKNLRKALDSDGRSVSDVSDGDDDRGEDAIIVFKDGTKLVAQVASVPSKKEILQEIGRGSEYIDNIPIDKAVEHILDAIQRKSKKYGPSCARMLLALDIRHFGMFSNPSVVDSINDQMEKIRGFRFAEIWLIGPTVSQCCRIA